MRTRLVDAGNSDESKSVAIKKATIKIYSKHSHVNTAVHTIKNYRYDTIKSSISASFHLSSDILNTSGSQSSSSSPRTM